MIKRSQLLSFWGTGESSCVQNQIAELWKHLEAKRSFSYKSRRKESKHYSSLKENEENDEDKLRRASKKHCDAAEEQGTSEVLRDIAGLEKR